MLSYEQNHQVKKTHNYKHVRFTNWMMDIFAGLHNYKIPSKDIFYQNMFKFYDTKEKNEKAPVIICRHDINGIRSKICKSLLKLNINIHYAGQWNTNVSKCSSLGNHRIHKFNYLKPYYFNICPENSNYDGYNTEKLLDALKTGTIPIYWGNTTEMEYFNQEKIIFFDQNFEQKFRKVLQNVEYYLQLQPFNDNFYEKMLQKEQELLDIFPL